MANSCRQSQVPYRIYPHNRRSTNLRDFSKYLTIDTVMSSVNGFIRTSLMQIVSCYFITLFALHVSDVIYIHPHERHIITVHITVHLPVSAACTLYVAPENGCILHPKHVEQKEE